MSARAEPQGGAAPRCLAIRVTPRSRAVTLAAIDRGPPAKETPMVDESRLDYVDRKEEELREHSRQLERLRCLAE